MTIAARQIPQDPKHMRIEQLLAMSSRIADAIAADIDALEQGQFGALKTTDPELDRLCALYAREVKALKAEGGLKGVPGAAMAQLKEAGARLNGLLARHQRLVTALRNASEGLVQTVAEEVQKTRDRVAPYSPSQKPKRGTGDAIVYNNVV